MSKGRYLVSTLSFFQRPTKQTHDLTIKFIAKKPKNVRNCESWASGDTGQRGGILEGGTLPHHRFHRRRTSRCVAPAVAGYGSDTRGYCSLFAGLFLCIPH